jgi:hypothetical protein
MRDALESRKEEEAGQPVALAWSELWMLPILLMQVICALFGQHLVKLKEMRRSRPLPSNWQDHLEGLREAEWPIQVLLAEGARQILAGKPLDLRGIACPDMPEDFQPALPRNALSVHLRMEQLARFNADPERYVRRHAERIAASEAARAVDPYGGASFSLGSAVNIVNAVNAFFPAAGVQLAASPADTRIRAPP